MPFIFIPSLGNIFTRNRGGLGIVERCGQHTIKTGKHTTKFQSNNQKCKQFFFFLNKSNRKYWIFTVNDHILLWKFWIDRSTKNIAAIRRERKIRIYLLNDTLLRKIYLHAKTCSCELMRIKIWKMQPKETNAKWYYF